MFKRFLLCSLCVLSFSAYADDWTGPYIGTSVGYVNAQDEGVRPRFPQWTNDISPEGHALDVHVGYNWRIKDKAIFGLELGYSDRKGLSDYESLKIHGAFDDDYGVTTNIRDVVSLSARLGRLFNQDKSLAYLLVGISKADVERIWLDSPASPSLDYTNYTQTGWTAGLGLEHAFTANLSLKSEFRFSNYGDETEDVNVWSDEIWTQSLTEKSLSIGVNYRF